MYFASSICRAFFRFNINVTMSTLAINAMITISELNSGIVFCSLLDLNRIPMQKPIGGRSVLAVF
jgi:hypothetical protein